VSYEPTEADVRYWEEYSKPNGATLADSAYAARHAGLGVGHAWTNRRCPAYRTLAPGDCACGKAGGS